jgi:hypothetical protein
VAALTGGVASRSSNLCFFPPTPEREQCINVCLGLLLNDFKRPERKFSAMPQTLMAEQLGSDAGLRPHSCLSCRQRKVKCDRQTPCSNCVKAAKQCSFILPVRGKRKRTKVPKEGLHAKLRRYEELLRSYGVNIEAAEIEGDYPDLEAGLQVDMGTAEDTMCERRGEIASIAPEERFFIEGGSSRYFDR